MLKVYVLNWNFRDLVLFCEELIIGYDWVFVFVWVWIVMFIIKRVVGNKRDNLCKNYIV